MRAGVLAAGPQRRVAAARWGAYRPERPQCRGGAGVVPRGRAVAGITRVESRAAQAGARTAGAVPRRRPGRVDGRRVAGDRDLRPDHAVGAPESGCTRSCVDVLAPAETQAPLD